MDENNKLMIPAQTSDRKDYVSGIGKKEVAVIGGSLVLSIMMVLISFALGLSVAVAMFIAFFIVASTICVIRRDAINESLIDKIGLIICYRKEQKQFLYVHYAFYELPETEVEQSDSK